MHERLTHFVHYTTKEIFLEKKVNFKKILLEETVNGVDSLLRYIIE